MVVTSFMNDSKGGAGTLYVVSTELIRFFGGKELYKNFDFNYRSIPVLFKLDRLVHCYVHAH